tara:strand:- start:11665 stop:11943 length:279 start_codon:yes stop_codon:yes gene_type:complete
MDYKLLKEEEADYIKACIIEGQGNIDVPIVPLQDYIDMFNHLGFIMDDLNDNLNAFNVSFFYTFTHKELGNYQLSGSLWYGDYSIDIKEDEE